MNSENTKKDIHPVPTSAYNTDSFDYLNASSLTDCTGAVPIPPQDSEELESYLDVYNFLPPCTNAKPDDETTDIPQGEKADGKYRGE